MLANKFVAIAALCMVSMVACKEEKGTNERSMSVGEINTVDSAGVRMIPIKTEFGTFNVWTKKFGANPKVKILLLHGGPAMGCEYMECFEKFLPQEGWEMYEYDQLGCNRSAIDQNHDELWQIDRFVEEVEQVRTALEMTKDNFYIIGNSWGGMLGMQYALKYQNNLKGMVVSNMMASFPEYAAYNGQLRAKMRPSLVDSLEFYESKEDFANPKYVEMVTEEYYRNHICRMNPFPDGLQRSFDHVNAHIYSFMQGPSEFVPGGNLAKWDIMERLHEINIPTLMIGAKYDTMDPAAMEKMSKMVENGRSLYCPEGSHLSMWDDQNHYYPGLIQFIKDVDSGKM